MYKPSGVEWLGDVPEQWGVKKLRYIARLKSGENITTEEFDDAGAYPVFGGNGVRGCSSRFTHDGTFVLIGRQGALCGNVNYASSKFWASEHAVVVSPRTELATVWMGELLRTMMRSNSSTTVYSVSTPARST
jgi:type I restriction enzyme S subunit